MFTVLKPVKNLTLNIDYVEQKKLIRFELTKVQRNIEKSSNTLVANALQ